MAITSLDKTFRYLATTENAAAAQIVRIALSSVFVLIREKALEAAIRMNHPGLLRGAFVTFARDGDVLGAMVGESHDQMARLAGRIVQLEDPAMGARACRIIADHHLYGAIPALVTRLHDPKDPLLPLAADTLYLLADAFHEELVRAEESAARRELDRKRDWISRQLEQIVTRFSSHADERPLEAFLVVAKRENSLLLRVLEDSKCECHAPAIKILETSAHGGVIRLLLSFLACRHAPSVIDRVISSREDVRFVGNMVSMTGVAPTKEVAQHLARLQTIRWAVPGHTVFSQLPSKLHPPALYFLRHTAIGREAVLRILEYTLQEGSVPGRRAAADILNQFHGAEADHLALRALGDPDATVRATIVREFRARHVPNAVALLTRIASERPEHEVANALREALPEFSLQTFLSRFEHMSDTLAAKLALLVRNIDRAAPMRLAEEMANISPVRRRRAVLAAQMMDCSATLERSIVSLVEDEDHRVRQAACEALAKVPTRQVFETLRAAVSDRSVSVQRAARQSLATIYRDLLNNKTQPLVKIGSSP